MCKIHTDEVVSHYFEFGAFLESNVRLGYFAQLRLTAISDAILVPIEFFRHVRFADIDAQIFVKVVCSVTS